MLCSWRKLVFFWGCHLANLQEKKQIRRAQQLQQLQDSLRMVWRLLPSPESSVSVLRQIHNAFTSQADASWLWPASCQQSSLPQLTESINHKQSSGESYTSKDDVQGEKKTPQSWNIYNLTSLSSRLSIWWSYRCCFSDKIVRNKRICCLAETHMRKSIPPSCMYIKHGMRACS